MRERLVDVVVALVRELPPAILGLVTAYLESRETGVREVDLAQFGVTPGAKRVLRGLAEVLSAGTEVDCKAIAVAVAVAAEAATRLDSEQRVQIAWTGPPAGAVPLRRVDQAVYEMLESSTSELLLVTYAAYKAHRALELLRRASERGVRVRLVLELASGGGRGLTFDGLDAIRAAVPGAELFHWPLTRRPQSAVGYRGAMHVKCLVVDRAAALISSANLTDSALEYNMELGLIAEGGIAKDIAAHFDRLVFSGELVPLGN